jgi:cold shock CspA family protein
MHGEYVGYVKWFSNNIGYGFVTVYTEGEMRGRDVFVHHSGVKPLNSNYRTLQKGEYISFDLGESDNGKQAINVTGVFGGPLMCDHRPSFHQDPSPHTQSDFTPVKSKKSADEKSVR